MDGRIQKFVAEQALLEQPFIKDTTKTVATVLREAVATVGEKISIRRFERSEPSLRLRPCICCMFFPFVEVVPLHA